MKQFIIILIISLFSFNASAQTDSTECMRSMYLYKEFQRLRAYNDAIVQWRTVYQNCPDLKKNLYIDGIIFYKEILKKETDAAYKSKYLDTIFFLYDQRIEYFGDEGFVKGRKGLDMFRYRGKNIQEIDSLFSKSIEIQGKNTEAAVLAYHFVNSIKLFKKGLTTKNEIVDEYLYAMEVFEYQLTDSPSSNMEKALKSSIQLVEKQLFSGKVIDCETIKLIYEEKFNNDPENIDLAKKIYRLQKGADCKTSALYEKIALLLFKNEPTSISAYRLVKFYLDKNSYKNASVYLKKAADLETDISLKSKFHYDLALIEYNQYNNYMEARNYAVKASKINPSWGKPYMLIGSLYAGSIRLCQDEDNLAQQIIYCLAVDMFILAKEKDSSITEDANKKIDYYKQYFPKKDDLFFHGYQEGQEFSIGCWINRTTTIRAK